MDQLRLILLIVGVVLIAGIFVWELWKKRAHDARREQLVEHLDAEERSGYAADSVIGDIGRVDPIGPRQVSPARRSGDGVGELGDEEVADLADYDIDEDFHGESESPVTESPVSESPVTESPVSESPVSESPVTGAPATAAAAAGVVAPAVARASAESRYEPREDEVLAPLSGLAARRDTPEQLDLAGLDLSATPRMSDDGAARRVGAAAAAARSERRRAQEEDEELHIVMTVMAKSGDRFSGGALREALEHADLYHGEMNIFHRHEQPKDLSTPTLFSAVNVLAPGFFEPDRMDSFTSPGIAMFMRLPGPEHPSEAFQKMLDAARTVAEDLDGKLCDESRSTLTAQSINHLRERIADFGRRQMLKA